MFYDTCRSHAFNTLCQNSAKTPQQGLPSLLLAVAFKPRILPLVPACAMLQLRGSNVHVQPWIIPIQTQTSTHRLEFLASHWTCLITVGWCNALDSWLNLATVNKHTLLILLWCCGTVPVLVRSVVNMVDFQLPDLYGTACLWCLLTVYTCCQENKNYGNIFLSIYLEHRHIRQMASK